MNDEVQTLRRLLWTYHIHANGRLGAHYGDDGEMQCSCGPIDFKRDTIGRIETVLSGVPNFTDGLSLSAFLEKITKNTSG